ncbi:general substrate transporter [Polychaeton citri CBS 116435]|uniref:General substrate transporter n=1 Tax=Polychaeton citri CBS 116435 TaxID=1314669 RepID=A0A9P4Q603_9PEZI|nr:general substrate transporter [Polychaeton citri CBS 116435]
MLSAKGKIAADGQPHFLGLSGRNLQFLVSTIATTGFLLFGYDQGVMSGIISAPDFNKAFPQTKDDANWQGFVTAIYEVGCLLGAIFQLAFGDKLGRRRAIIFGGVIMILGVVIQISSIVGHSATAQLIIGRTITGFGNGMNTSTIPTYQAECSKSKNRGLLICIEGGVIAIGTLIAYWIDYGSQYGPADFTWRFPIAFQIVFGLILCIAMIWLPESPRWLLTRDRQEEAMHSLAALRGVPLDDDSIKIEAGIINDSIRMAGQLGGNTPIKEVFTNGKTQHFRRMLLGASSQFFQQIGGCNAVIYYFPILFEDSILGKGPNSHSLALLLGGVNMIVYSIFATTSWFVVERVGRRKLFLIGTVGQCLSMVLVFAALIPCQGLPEGQVCAPAKGAAVGLFTYIAFFGATWLPLPWLYPAEINPLRTRSKANALSTCSNWIWNTVVVMITPVMVSQISWGTYLFFACTNACFFPCVYFFYPETSGRSLEEIDLIFAKGFLENKSYVLAAKQLPHLNHEEIDAMSREYGFISDDEEGQFKEAKFNEKETNVHENSSENIV